MWRQVRHGAIALLMASLLLEACANSDHIPAGYVGWDHAFGNAVSAIGGGSELWKPGWWRIESHRGVADHSAAVGEHREDHQL